MFDEIESLGELVGTKGWLNLKQVFPKEAKYLLSYMKTNEKKYY